VTLAPQPTNTTPLPALAYSIQDAALFAGVSVRYLFQEIQAGRLVSKKAGRRRLIPAAALKSWIDNCPEA